MVKATGQEFLQTAVYLNIALYWYGNPAENYYTLRTLLYSYSCGSQVNARASSGIIFHERWVRRDYPSEVMDVLLHYSTRSCMSHRLVSGKYLSITK